jgi:uncharacterized protein YerC
MSLVTVCVSPALQAMSTYLKTAAKTGNAWATISRLCIQYVLDDHHAMR